MNYYFISYHFQNGTQIGFGNVTRQSPEMFSRAEITKVITEILTKQGFIATPRDVVILYWNSITEQEFNKFNSDEFTIDSTVDDGTGVPGINQGEVQGNSKVQQGDNGQGSGDSDVTRRPGSGGEPNSEWSTNYSRQTGNP